MIQKNFAERATRIIEKDPNVEGLAVGGSWLTGEMDEYSDLDFILVTKSKISNDQHKMRAYAMQLGQLLSAFTGEHVGEPRLLICLYDNPLLHVDIKFLTIEDFYVRVEDPVILFDRSNHLNHALQHSSPQYPKPDYQWIEDRFWTWIHYALVKVARGEYLEAFDFLSFLRMTVLGPLLQVKNQVRPSGVRKVEAKLKSDDLNILLSTIATYNRKTLLISLSNAVELYRELRKILYSQAVSTQTQTEMKVTAYFDDILRRRV